MFNFSVQILEVNKQKKKKLIFYFLTSMRITRVLMKTVTNN